MKPEPSPRTEAAIVHLGELVKALGPTPEQEAGLSEALEELVLAVAGDSEAATGSAPADGTEFFTGPGSAETPQERRERWERNLLYRLAAAVRAYTLEVDDGVIYSMDEADWFDVLSKATVSQGYSKYDDLVWENKKRHSKPPVSE